MTLRSPLGRLLALAVVPALVVVVLALWLSGEAGKSPVQVIPALGVLLWMAAAAIALFTALSGLVWQPRCRGLLLLGGLLSLLHSLDDLFLLHERSSAPAFHLLYVGVAIFILVRFWDLLVDSGSALSFLSAVFFLSSSILFDGAPRIFPFSYEQVQMLEEGSQFIGIACWLLFWWQVSAFAAKLRPVH